MSTAGVTDPPVDREDLLHLYEQMFKIRTFEENVNELPLLVHL